MCPARHILRDSMVSRQEVMPPPQVGSLHQGPSKGIFFPTGAGFFYVVPRLPQASQPASTATPGCLTQVTPQSLSPMCPGLPRSLSWWRGQGSAQGQHCTSSNLTPWPWHSWSHHGRDRAAPGAAPAGSRGCVLPPRGGGYGLRSLKCQTTRRSLEIHLSPLPLGAARAGRLWR